MLTPYATARYAFIGACLAAASAQGGQLKASAIGWQDADTNTTGSSSTVERRHYHLSYQWGTAGNDNQLAYQHQTLLIREGEPGNNGYLHQIDGQVSRQTGPWNITAELGVHGSSNMFKHQEFHEDALVGTFDIRYRVYHAQVGVSGDYRFDDRFRIYPTAARDIPLSDGSILSVDLPVGVDWTSADKQVTLSIERYGEKWATLDEEQLVESSLYLNEWRVLGTVDMLRSSNCSVGIFVGWSFDTKVTYWDLLDKQNRISLDDSFFTGVEVIW